MPRVLCRSSIACADPHLLRLELIHTLNILPTNLCEKDHTLEPAPLRLRRAPFPGNLDIHIPGSQVPLKVQGFLDGAQVESAKFWKSGFVFEISRFLRKNSDVLGIEIPPDASCDDQAVIFTLTPNGAYHPPPATSQSTPPVYLESILIQIICRSTKHPQKEHESVLYDSPTSPCSQVLGGCDIITGFSSNDPFSEIIAVPHLVPWSDLMQKFFSTHLIQRYPLVFGRWRMDHAHEATFFSSVSSSLSSMILRSSNKDFKRKAKTSFKVLQGHRTRLVDSSWRSLGSIRSATASDMVVDDDVATDYRNSLPTRIALEGEGDDEASQFADSIKHAMSRLYQLNIRPARGIKLSTMQARGDALQQDFDEYHPESPTADIEEPAHDNVSDSAIYPSLGAMLDWDGSFPEDVANARRPPEAMEEGPLSDIYSAFDSDSSIQRPQTPLDHISDEYMWSPFIGASPGLRNTGDSADSVIDSLDIDFDRDLNSEADLLVVAEVPDSTKDYHIFQSSASLSCVRELHGSPLADEMEVDLYSVSLPSVSIGCTPMSPRSTDRFTNPIVDSFLPPPLSPSSSMWSSNSSRMYMDFQVPVSQVDEGGDVVIREDFSDMDIQDMESLSEDFVGGGKYSFEENML